MVAPFWNAIGFALPMTAAGLQPHMARMSRGFSPRVVTTDGRFADSFAVGELSVEELDAVQADWTDLSARALDPNVFYEPGFALSAARHFPLRERARFIAVWDARGAEKRMMGLFPIVSPNPFYGDGLVRLWLHKQAALATPLVDRTEAVATTAAFLSWLEENSLAAGVVFARTRANGRFFEALHAVATQQQRDVKILDAYERAALLPAEAEAPTEADPDEICARAIKKKKINELNRQRRRLREMGELSFHSHVSAGEIRAATEEFLALEASGWKAGRGALLSQPSLTTFLRSATRLLAREGHCKIMSLRLDGRPISMAIVLESQGHSYCWKIAYDEAYRAQAPGIQLIYEQTRAQVLRPEIEITDSCAIPNHPMIDRVWAGRAGVCDVAVQLQSGGKTDFFASCRRDRARRSAREFAKRAAARVLKRRIV